MDVRAGLWRKLSAEKLMLLNYGVGEDSWESLGLEVDPTSPSWRRSVLGVHWKDWCWSWNSNTLATPFEELTHWKRPWCWEGLGTGGEGENRGWNRWMQSPTRCTWVWLNTRSWWWTGRPCVLLFMGSQRVGHNWVTELNWTEQWFWASFHVLICHLYVFFGKMYFVTVQRLSSLIQFHWVFGGVVFTFCIYFWYQIQKIIHQEK